ncbi:putative metal-dependent hydrolase [Aureibaculum marinum]|uniref:Putative metal-dependent hydrolase n=1 Tax=Aureibaculum marinum TaxID=2487930 RepID=A0A3N4NE34_9FLAO|nr:putative metal-dependent hydrolase [Aureibaculum marinum]RPD91686.1 putative metal-dependent hydrolase [Aureibaculum marinum]
MHTIDLESLKYPIGKPEIPNPITSQHIRDWITILEEFPEQLSKLVINLTEEQLNTPYRPEGWTVRQVIHHLADSHHNSYIRFKWALTEVKPIIKPYYEDRWAELRDSKSAPILLSLNALTALHQKWVYFLKGLTPNELQHTFIYPDSNEEISLAQNIGIYAWHSVHHYAHINSLKKRMSWK